MSALDQIADAFDRASLREAVGWTLHEIVRNAAIVDVSTQESMSLDPNSALPFSARPKRARVTFTARPMVARPTLVVMTATKYGRVTVGSIDVDASNERLDTRFTTTLPKSLFDVETVRFDHSTGRVLVTLTVDPEKVSADDLNAPDTPLGRLVRFSIAQRVAAAPATSVNFDDMSSRLDKLKQVLGGGAGSRGVQ